MLKLPITVSRVVFVVGIGATGVAEFKEILLADIGYNVAGLIVERWPLDRNMPPHADVPSVISSAAGNSTSFVI